MKHIWFDKYRQLIVYPLDVDHNVLPSGQLYEKNVF